MAPIYLFVLTMSEINLKTRQNKEMHQAILFVPATQELAALVLGLTADLIWGKDLGGLESRFACFLTKRL